MQQRGVTSTAGAAPTPQTNRPLPVLPGPAGTPTTCSTPSPSASCSSGCPSPPPASGTRCCTRTGGRRGQREGSVPGGAAAGCAAMDDAVVLSTAMVCVHASPAARMHSHPCTHTHARATLQDQLLGHPGRCVPCCLLHCPVVLTLLQTHLMLPAAAHPRHPAGLTTWASWQRCPRRCRRPWWPPPAACRPQRAAR